MGTLRVQKDTATRVGEVLEAWQKLRPHKSFYGMTLEQFKLEVKPFLDARAEIADLEIRLQHAASKRDIADTAAMQTVQGVVSAVRGDREEGANGELYAAMGYVPPSQRNSGLKRPRKAEPVKINGSA